MPAYYPVFLDVRARRCVVIGGGDVGQEKAVRLLEYGADVLVVSPEVNGAVSQMADDGRLTWIRRQYEPGDLEGALIAIVADTGDAHTNSAVSREARARNVPLNVVDMPELCTWIAPAVARRGDVTVAASTGGASPALARRIREEISGESRRRSRHPVMALADLAPLLSFARGELRSEGIRLRADHWQASLDDGLVDLVQAGRTGEARATLMARLRVGAGCDCPEGACMMWEEPLAIVGGDDGAVPTARPEAGR